MKSGVLIGGAVVATVVAGGGTLIYKFSGDARKLSDDKGGANADKTLPGSTYFINSRSAQRRIGTSDFFQSDQFPKLLDCSDCSEDEWKKLTNFLKSFGSSSDTAKEQYKLDKQLYEKDDPFTNYSADHVSPPTKHTADEKWFAWRTQWTSKIQGTPNEPWQCVLNLTLENLRKHFPKIIPEETPTTSAQCSSL